MKISLFYITPCNLGGWVTYTVHLVRSLKQMGYEVNLYEIKNNNENKQRPFAEDIKYQNVSLEKAVEIAKSELSIVVALDRRYYDIGFPVLQEAKTLVIHDTVEVTAKLTDFIKKFGVNVISIRNAIEVFLAARGVRSNTILHPYVPYALEYALGDSRDWNAIATSRIDWDKHTHIIFEANEMLEKMGREDRKVRVYGCENRLYTHHKITPRFPNWRTNYYFGRFKTGDAVRLAAHARYVVDLTEIKADGGGTQYTFLEAFNAGAVLIVNSNWIDKVETDVLKRDENCLVVNDAESLKNALLSEDIPRKEIVSAGKSLLKKHSPELIIPSYIQIASSR